MNKEQEALKIIAHLREEIKLKDEIIHKQAAYAQTGEMLNMIAHQWRQPLNAISGSAVDILLQSSLGEVDRDKISEVGLFIQNEAQKMSNIIDEFIELNKPESNKEFFLYDVVSEVEKMIYPQLKSRAIVLEIEIESALSVYHNFKSIEHVLLNLIINARDAFESQKNNGNKKIKIFTLSNKDSHSLIIEDNAGGIADEIKDEIFNPYFTTKEQGKGSGVGLYMSKKMIERVEGSSLSLNVTGSQTQFILKFYK